MAGSKSVEAYTWEEGQITASDMVAGRDDDTALSAGQAGEIAYAEVGEDGRLSAYDAVIIGQPPEQNTGDSKGNEPYVKLQSGGADVADTVEYRLGARKKGDLDGPSITGWRTHRGQDNADPRQRQALNPQSPFVRDGRLVTLQAKDETASVTADLSESEFQIPVLLGTEK